MKSKVILEFEGTEEDTSIAKFIQYHSEIRAALFHITHNLRKSTENFIESKELEPTNYGVLEFVMDFINEQTKDIPNDILEF